jgi:hypothetical protein
MNVRRLAGILLAVLAVAAPAAQAGYVPGGASPNACSGSFFSDRIGTLAAEMLAGERKPQRIYGLTGADWLVGSPTRASCLFGGQGDDVLMLGKGGGIALGEDGRDFITGSPLVDALDGGDGGDLLTGGDSGDVLRGGRGIDALEGGQGDDLLDATDGRAEIVSCGLGADTVYGDKADVLLGCEKWDLKGEPLRQKRLDTAVGGRRAVFAAPFTAPATVPAGGFQVIVAAGGCPGAPVVAWRSPALERGEGDALILKPPKGGWCPGTYSGAVVRAPACPKRHACAAPPPAEPLAWLSFVVR